MTYRRLLSIVAVAVVGLALISPAAAIIIVGGKSVHLVPYSAGQTVRVHAANLGSPEVTAGSCEIMISWFQPNGMPAGADAAVSVRPGTVEFADFVDARAPVRAPRALKIVAVLANPPDDNLPCMVQFQVFDRFTGRTQYVGAPDVFQAAR